MYRTGKSTRRLADSQQGEFDVVFSEALDRISRDTADTAQVFKTLEFRGIALYTTTEGPIGDIQAGVAGIMNQLFLKQLGEKTRRGQIARVRAGSSGGGRCYGYDLRERGLYTINAAQAAVVRRIFEAYDAGSSPRAIAAALNAEGVPGPRGGTWTAASINGDRRVGDGILHQALYHGERVFNRRRFRKHPESGRRSSIINPPDQWIRTAAADLRIVDDDLWHRVQARKAALSEQPLPARRRPKRLLDGLVKCGVCGGSMTVQGYERYGCSAHHERGTCINARTVAIAAIEARVLQGVKARLLRPDLIEEAMRAYELEVAAAQARSVAERLAAEKTARDANDRITRLLDLYERSEIGVETFRARLGDLEARRDAARRELEALEPSPVYVVHPPAVEHYRNLVDRLQDALRDGQASQARDAFRGLLDRVMLTPPGSGENAFQIKLEGRLGALMTSQQDTPPEGIGKGAVVMGAGTGFEPVTFRL